MIYGYARVSTNAQDLAAQIERLERAGCDKIFREKLTGKHADRAQLLRLLQGLQAGDQVLAVVTDRIARDPLDMLNILNEVKAKGAGLRLLDEPFIDTTSEMADLTIFLVGWAAKWQRKRILENTAHGRERAKARGVKMGRPYGLTAHQQREAIARRDDPARVETLREIAASYDVSHSTISRLSI